MTDVEGREGGGSASAAGMQRAQQRFRLRARIAPGG
jgi:hypothetical protein